MSIELALSSVVYSNDFWKILKYKKHLTIYRFVDRFNNQTCSILDILIHFKAYASVSWLLM